MGWVVFVMNIKCLEAYAMTLPFYINTQPKPTLNASQYTKKPWVTFGTVKMGAVVKLFFNSWKFFSQPSDHENLTICLVNLVKGDEIDENPSTKILQYLVKPKKD